MARNNFLICVRKSLNVARLRARATKLCFNRFLADVIAITNPLKPLYQRRTPTQPPHGRTAPALERLYVTSFQHFWPPPLGKKTATAAFGDPQPAINTPKLRSA